MIEVSHVLVLSQEQFVERRVSDAIRGSERHWTSFLWPFGRR